MRAKQLLSGLILGGGQSRRMGQDKSTLEFHGRTQKSYLFDVLSNFCQDVYFSCKNKNAIPEEFFPLEDAFDLESPLNGILTAFSLNPHNAWITVPVDMPNIDASTIQYLLYHRDTSKIATCFYDSDGQHPEPLLTIWEPLAGAVLNDFFRTGGTSPRTFLMSHNVNIVSAPNKDVLTNINTPEELAAFRNVRKTKQN